MQQYRDSDAMAWSLGLGRGSSSSSAGQSASDSESDSELSSTGCQAQLAGLRVPAPAAWIAPVFAWHWNAGRASVRSLQGLSAASLDRRGRHQFVHLPYN